MYWLHCTAVWRYKMAVSQTQVLVAKEFRGYSTFRHWDIVTFWISVRSLFSNSDCLVSY